MKKIYCDSIGCTKEINKHEHNFLQILKNDQWEFKVDICEECRDKIINIFLDYKPNE